MTPRAGAPSERCRSVDVAGHSLPSPRPTRARQLATSRTAAPVLSRPTPSGAAWMISAPDVAAARAPPAPNRTTRSVCHDPSRRRRLARTARATIAPSQSRSGWVRYTRLGNDPCVISADGKNAELTNAGAGAEMLAFTGGSSAFGSSVWMMVSVFLGWWISQLAHQRVQFSVAHASMPGQTAAVLCTHLVVPLLDTWLGVAGIMHRGASDLRTSASTSLATGLFAAMG